MTNHLSQSILTDTVHSIVSFWLQSQIFLSRYMPLEIRVTFLQMMNLVVKTKDSV